MIVFYGEDFELNLTGTRITLVEENPLFYNYFVRNYSWPFSKKMDAETSKKLAFIDLENSALYNTKLYGNLLIDGEFDVAYIILTDFKNDVLEGNIFYGQASISLLETPLNELPFPVVSTSLLTSHAQEVIAKQYPEVSYNFPMVIDGDLHSRSKYEKFEGIVNNYVNGAHVVNTNQVEEEVTIAYNRNVLVPFPYLMGVLKTGFDSAGMVMQGSFVSDKVNEKILVYTDKVLEKFYSGLPDGFQFFTTNEVWQNGVVSAVFSNTYSITQTGSYAIKLFLNIPNNLNVVEFKVIYANEVIYTTASRTIDRNLILNIKETANLGDVVFELQLEKITSNSSNSIGDISSYNKFDFSFTDGQLNIFPNSFSLSEVMPDLTFGQLLNKIKNWLNLEITFDKNVVTMSYIESKFLDVTVKDETHLEIEKPHRKFNQNKLYKLITSNDSFFVSKEGITPDAIGYREEDITKIDMELEIMPIQSKDGVFTAYKDPDTNDFKLLLYDGLQNSLPVAVEQIYNRNFSLHEVYGRYWKNWLYFRLNSETYKDKFPVHILEKFSISSGRYKYNKKHIYKKIKKRRILENYWEVEIESETLP